MLKMLVLSLLLVSITIIQAAPRSSYLDPETDKMCRQYGYLPNPTNPHQFYQCQYVSYLDSYELHLMDCRPNTKWVQLHLTCELDVAIADNSQGQAIDPIVWRTFIESVQTGKSQVLTGEQNLKADIASHPDNRAQHKTYCGQLITMINNIRIKIDEFGRAYPGLMDAPQASAWAHEGSMAVFILSDLNQLYKSI